LSVFIELEKTWIAFHRSEWQLNISWCSSLLFFFWLAQAAKDFFLPRSILDYEQQDNFNCFHGFHTAAKIVQVASSLIKSLYVASSQ